MPILRAATLARLTQLANTTLARPPYPPPSGGPMGAAQAEAAADLVSEDVQVVRSIGVWADELDLEAVQDLCMRVACGRVLRSPLLQRPSLDAVAWHERLASALPAAWFHSSSTGSLLVYALLIACCCM